MSYRNPQQIVDTQTGQHYRDLQKTVSNAFAGVAGAYKQEKKEEQTKEEARRKEELAKMKANKAKTDALLRGIQLEEDSVYDRLAKKSALNPDIDFGESFTRVINSYSDIKNSIELGLITDPKEVANLKAKLANIRTLPDRAANSLQSIMVGIETLNEKSSNRNQMGGIDTSSNPDVIKDLLVLGNKIKGGRGFDISEDENGSFQLGFNVTRDGKTQFYSEDTLREFIQGDNPMIPLIPDETSKFDTALDTYVYEVDPVTKKKVIKQDYIGDLTTDPKLFKGRIKRYNTIDKDAIVEVAKNDLHANVDSMTTQQKISFGNWIGLRVDGDKEVALTVDNVEKYIDPLKDAYVEMWKKRIPSEANTYFEKPENQSGKGSGKLTQTEINRARKIEDLNYIGGLFSEKKYTFSPENIEQIASSVGVDYDSNLEDAEGNLKGSIIRNGDKKITIRANDSREEVFKKILQIRIPGLSQKLYDTAVKKLEKATPEQLNNPDWYDEMLPGFMTGETSEKESDNNLDAFGNPI